MLTSLSLNLKQFENGKNPDQSFWTFEFFPGIFKRFLWYFLKFLNKEFSRDFKGFFQGIFQDFPREIEFALFLVGRTILVLNSQALQMDFARESSSPLFYEISIVTLLLISVFFVNAIATAKAKPLIQISNEFSQKCLIASQKLKALKENWDISSHRHVKPTISELIISNTGCPNKF